LIGNRIVVLQFVFASITVLGSADPALSEPQSWETPLISQYLIHEETHAESCESFAKGDFQSAFKTFRMLAETGDAGAQNNLGVTYEAGAAVPESKIEAIKWYQKSAVQGNAMAQHNLGVILAVDHILGTPAASFT
jgi:hypothetical protein